MKKINPLNKQKGVVLIVSLVMLLLLTLIGITGAQVTSLEEKMAGNSRDQNIAFQAAESTLLVAEEFIMANPINGTYTAVADDNTDGLLTVVDPEPDYFLANTWASNSVETPASFGGNVNNSLTSISNPRYIIQRMGLVPGRSPPESAFKITARAQGLNPGTQVILQEIFARTN